MIEFSESYHLKTNDTNEVVQLLKTIGLKGFIFNEKNGWVSFVIDGTEFIPNKLLINHNPGVLIHYANVESNGFFITLYQYDVLKSHYEIMFDEENQCRIKTNNFVIDPFYELIKKNNHNLSITDILPKFIPSNPNLNNDYCLAEEIAQLIGLPYYSWISYQYVLSSYKNQTNYQNLCIYVK